jgi:hypothetical protein
MPNSDKTAKISDFPVIKNVERIQRLLGLAGYYRRFIPIYSELANLTQGGGGADLEAK